MHRTTLKFEPLTGPNRGGHEGTRHWWKARAAIGG